MSDLEKQAKIKEALSFCNGSERFYKFQLCNNIYTDGIAQMAALCEADWLVTDALVSCSYLSRRHSFIEVKFQYTPELNSKEITAKVTYSDGNDVVLCTEFVMVTNFPLQEIKMFYKNNTLYLPSEE